MLISLYQDTYKELFFCWDQFNMIYTVLSGVIEIKVRLIYDFDELNYINVLLLLPYCVVIDTH